MDVFIRTKRYECGKWLEEIDLLPRTEEAEMAVKGERTKKGNVTRPAQNKINDKNSRRYLRLLINGTFYEGDLMLTLGYSDKYLPATVAEAKKEVTNFLSRYKRLRKKMGLDALKYVVVTEYKLEETESDEEIFSNRVHHHIILNGGVDRDLIENLWSKKLPGQPKEKMGYANARRLHFNDEGIVGLANYITKARHGKKGSKRWSSSQNLEKPVMTPVDGKFSVNEVNKMALSNDQGRARLEKEYPNHFITRIEPVYYEETGWHIYLKMRKKDSYGKRKKAENPNNKKWP